MENLSPPQNGSHPSYSHNNSITPTCTALRVVLNVFIPKIKIIRLGLTDERGSRRLPIPPRSFLSSHCIPVSKHCGYSFDLPYPIVHRRKRLPFFRIVGWGYSHPFPNYSLFCRQEGVPLGEA
jgi:hypothetical protein